ncbi:deoxynucleoside kinase, partial [Pseudoalteromonas sp. GAB2316C]|uniref:deoxynucleoside kinase n=1 Tax=Pseudoalteromonas sp. GAB2316C TaxID=3025326 RepID=UPI002359BE03
MENKIRICISGMIAVGKSTLARALAKDFDMELISEAKLGISYLERLFEDPARWGYEAQAAF